MEHSPRIKFLIPKKKVEFKKEPTIRDQMEFHEQVDSQYDGMIKAHVQKAIHKNKEEKAKKVRFFWNCLFLSHLLVLFELWMAWRIWTAVFK